MIDPFQPFEWALAHGRMLTLGPKGLLMAIINVTPDSFSDGGSYAGPEAAVSQALRCIDDGAGTVGKQQISEIHRLFRFNGSCCLFAVALWLAMPQALGKFNCRDL